MKKKYHMSLLLLVCLLLTGTQTAWAQENTIAFQETFNTNTGTGGRDGKYKGSIATSDPKSDNDVWTATTYFYGGNECVRLGNTSNDGNGTSPTIALTGTKYALLTYSAAGWGDAAKNKISVTSTTDGVTLTGDVTNVELVNEEWNDYTALIELPSEGESFTLTFTGKRIFLDDIVVRNINSVPQPTLTEEYTFWPNTNEANGQQTITLVPVSWTTVYYTTDGTEPSSSNGKTATMATPITINGTTTVKAIAYVGSIASSVVTKTYTQGATVDGIATFKTLAEGTEARLHLSSTPETRVTFANSQEAYLRTGSEVLCLDFNTTAVFNPSPATQQHVAGWIVGKYQTVNGRPTLVATANTNTSYLALAPQKNEATIAPKAISSSEVNTNVGEWVTIEEQPFGTVTASNTFGLTSAIPYDGAIADVTGIVTATNKLAPTEAVTFVIDEAKDFTVPATDLANANVRLKRTLSSSYWNTFCVPFDITDISGQIRAYDHLDGQTMKFTDAASITAGTPYLVKPDADVVNPEYNNVTLKATTAQTVTNSGYGYVGTYSPVSLKTDKTELFLKTDGKLYYPSNSGNHMKGMRAYFRVPSGAPAHILIDGEATAIEQVTTPADAANTIYDLQGRKIDVNGQHATHNIQRGLYIVNGKKMVIH